MKKALTIGELLITMTVIGVIAALTLPSFMKDYHNKLFTTRLKKTYESLTSAMEQACIDSNVSYFNQTPYAKVGAVDKQAEFLNKYFKLSGVAITSGNRPFATTYRKMGSNTGEPLQLPTSAYARLKSGEAIDLMCETLTECIVTVDVNSTDGPNVGGRDMFRFRIDTVNKKVFSHVDPASCNNGNKDIYGHGCLNKIIEDNWVMKY